MINKEDILDYGFYDENHKYIVKLNEDKLKEIFGKDKQVDISKENDDEIKQ